ncbi:hypothetical protein ACFT5B_03845 [Luteimicrobium sp. NPDC057192]|uniref:hypothetical protein n=1 Tax=Luteimicrobium sp. NPDC057192 TaxID=3346042 RepID=UPI00362A9159
MFEAPDTQNKPGNPETGNRRRGVDELTTRLYDAGLGAAKARKIAKLAMRTPEPILTAYYLLRQHRAGSAAFQSALVDLEHGRPLTYRDSTGEDAAWSVLGGGR